MPVTVERMEEILKDTLTALAESSDCIPAADLGILDSAIDLTEAKVETLQEREANGEGSAYVLDDSRPQIPWKAQHGVSVEWPNGRRFLVAVLEVGTVLGPP